MTIKVILALSDEKEKSAVRKVLAEMGSPKLEIIGSFENPEELVRLAASAAPAVVLLSAQFAREATIPLVERLTANPLVQVIVLLLKEDFNIARQFILSGAVDALPFEQIPSELPKSLESAFKRAQKLVRENYPRPSQIGQILVFYGPKGGVGTSLLVTNLAVALSAYQPEPVVLVDLNLQFGAVTTLLNLRPEVTIASLAQRFQGELDFEFLQSFLVNHEESNLKILAAPSRPELSELVTTFLVEKTFQVLRNNFAYIIVDTPTVLQDTTLAAFDIADQILLVTALDLLAIRNSQLVLEMLRKLYPSERIKLVLNRSNARFSGLNPEQVEEFLGISILAQIPSDGQVAVTSVNEGVPFVLSSPNSPLAQSIFKLASIIAGDRFNPPVPVIERAQENVLKRVVKFLLGEE
ncbi:MAG: AAA family ATPase [Armatimonadetes bacterium]|nr:AAA family ATPase [Armatimonadota bacterium]MDW8028584.1 AAA family ATPase [Armatimonadota bacterium]